MRSFLRSALILAATVGLALPVRATVYLDDTWADGTRNNQALPTNSAWFASSGLSATTGSMNLAVPSGSDMAITYFTTTNNSPPVSLNIGDTLVFTFNMTFTGIAASNSGQGLRIGVFDFADSSLSPKRVTADGFSTSSQGSGVKGYSLFQNMGAIFSSSSPMDVRVRTNLSSSSLLGTGADFKSLGTGPGSTAGFNGFSSGTPYILQMSLQRTDSNAMAVTVSWLDVTNGVSLTTTVTDTTSTNFAYDGISLRPAGSGSSASTITFTEAKVELIPGSTPASISLTRRTSPSSWARLPRSVCLPVERFRLSYQWYYNTNSPLSNATNSTLTVTNAQVADSGGYSVLVSNTYGSATSAVAQLSVTIPDPPSIITQPQDQTALPGESATFSVTAGGSEPLSYQWYYNNSTLLTNATDTTLTLTNIQVGNAGLYSVVVSNIAGTATSSNAVLNVNTNPVAPVFTSQPLSQIIVQNDNVTFSADCDRVPPPCITSGMTTMSPSRARRRPH